MDPEELVLDDVIRLSAGDQIPSDAIVLEGFAEVNEAMLTGESDLVQKEVEDLMLSGSFLASGSVLAQVHHVGADNYAAKLMLEAKTVKPINSRIMKSLDQLAGFTGKIIIPFGIALLLEALVLKGLPLKSSVVNSSTALLGMLPKGIALLTITSLLTAVIKLGLKKVLVQEMYSVETLARVDMLCLDKTGTITQGKMQVEAVLPLTATYGEETIASILTSYIAHSEDKNPTSQAPLRKLFPNLLTPWLPTCGHWRREIGNNRVGYLTLERWRMAWAVGFLSSPYGLCSWSGCWPIASSSVSFRQRKNGLPPAIFPWGRW